jgi:phosphoglycerol transferase MdoB-like AlkP superfamily enzyme
VFKPVYTTVREVLSGRDWAYLGALLVPLAIFVVVTKSLTIATKETDLGFFGTLNLVRSDVLFMVGYAVLWVGLFALARTGLARKAVVVLFHAISLVVVLIATVAYQYFEATGSTLDWTVVAFYLATLGEVKDIIASEAAWYVWAALVAALLYALFGPWAITRVLAPRAGGGTGASGSQVRVSRLAPLGLCFIALGVGSLSLVPGASDANRALSLTPPVNVVATGLSMPGAAELDVEEASATSGASLAKVELRETSETERRNVVIILLESTGARSTTLYEEFDMPETTPYLEDLASESLLVDRAYTTIPHTSKAITSVNCGIYPHPETDIHEAEPGNIPVRCLPELLGEHGYDSVFFQSATEEFEDRPELVENFGYDDFYGLGEMDTSGFEKAGYLGYEDDIMLDPSRDWLEENATDGSPFMATYLTITPHHEYLAPTRYGREPYSNEEAYNKYLNAVHYVDQFVENVIDQYKELGIYEDTVFIIVGDHGEAFGEHGVKGHDGVPYEEGLRVPLIVHDPRSTDDGDLTAGPTNHLDIAPTILDVLGYRTARGAYPGASVLGPYQDRTLYFGCRPDLLCMASIRGDEKYIYHFGKQPDEFYDLGEDPFEKNNLADRIATEELESRREDLLAWRSRSAATFDDQ